MNRPAPRSIAEYLHQLRDALAGEDAALVQDALYDAEEYLRSELAAHPGKSEGDALELIASTYGAPEEVATAYRDTEVKVKAALATPRPLSPAGGTALRRFFGVYSDPRAWTSLLFMVLSLATGILYFTFTVVGLSLSMGLAVLIIGVPFFLTFVGLTRVIALGEGRLIEAITGERMPRRPQHPGPALGFGARIKAMLSDARTWTTIGYFLLMLPLGVGYFVFAIVGVSVGVAFLFTPLWEAAKALGLDIPGGIQLDAGDASLNWIATPIGLLLMFLAGLLLVTVTMHGARAIGRAHARMAKALLVTGA